MTTNKSISKMTIPAYMNCSKIIYVGAPGENKPFTIHPDDQTDPNERIYLYYDRLSKRMHIFNPDSYEGIESLPKKKILGFTSSVLYRGIYIDGSELVVPVYDYAANTELSLSEVVEIAQSGEWMVRDSNNQYDIYKSNDKPKWSDNSFEDLLQIAFEGHVIESESHPLVKNFRYLK
ncbi:MAG: hypothetical protein U1E26_11735 [Coriobacteriia bacterium]|nr:hypothetical protein [Methylobacter sp.]MDZ4170307.1 hypothetical protein [Coriobacteriia bacterium]MDP2098399.1 hypothetical protein [Methylobacter sp.]MDP2429061.1 hypothetical protein [Methylobacter sp.]MDP3055373.1 hypothetical protein [Methylobacter sp.]